MAAVGNLVVRVPDSKEALSKFEDIIVDFFREVPVSQSYSGRSVKWGDWGVVWKWLTNNNGGGFVGYTNNKILGRSVYHCEPVTGPVAFLMWKHVNIAMFSTQLRRLWIQYSHDGWDFSDPLNFIMRSLYGHGHAPDRHKGMVSFMPMTAPTGEPTVQCNITLGVDSNPPVICRFSDKTMAAYGGKYMDSTLVLYEIGLPDGNNVVHLKQLNHKPSLRKAEAQPVTFIDGGEVGLW